MDQEVGLSLSTDKYAEPRHDDHFVTADLPGAPATGEGARNVYPTGPATQVLRYDAEVQVATHGYGAGRSVYLAGLPYTPDNARLLHRAVLWAAGHERTPAWWSDNPAVDVAAFPDAGCWVAVNSTLEPQSARVTLPDGEVATVALGAAGSAWADLG